MHDCTQPVPECACTGLVAGAPRFSRALAAAGLLLCGAGAPGPLPAAPAAEDAAAPAVKLEASGQWPAARWQRPGWDFVVELAVDPSVGAAQSAAMSHYAIGVTALPVTLVQPQIAIVLPFYLLFAAPWQAVFNARADALARVLVAEPLPDAVTKALRAQWRQPAAPAPAQAMRVTLRLAGYGLAARSGRKLEAFDSAEDLCLVAQGRLEVARGDAAALAEDIAIGPQSTTRDAPPPLCAPLSRWAAEDGRLLRQATREMAELLAAFIVDRAERQP